MNDKSELELTRTEKIAILIKDNNKYLVFAGIAFILFLAGAGILEYVGRQKAEKSVLAAEAIEDVLVNYMNAADEDKPALKEDLTEKIASAKTDYPKLYAHMRALNAEAQLYSDSREWEKAANSFMAITDLFPESYLAPVSLLNASAMKEQNNDAPGAILLLERLVSNYKNISPDIPEALFDLGRLNEGLGDMEKAMSNYNIIIDEYSSSSWNNLAKSRIIAIK